MCNHSYSVFSLTWPASIQIYWNKRDSKELAMEITSLNPDFLGESNYM